MRRSHRAHRRPCMGACRRAGSAAGTHGKKIRDSLSGATPQPSSTTRKRSHSCVPWWLAGGVRVTSTFSRTLPPAGVNLTLLASRLRMTFGASRAQVGQEMTRGTDAKSRAPAATAWNRRESWRARPAQPIATAAASATCRAASAAAQASPSRAPARRRRASAARTRRGSCPK
jgi:hypothetical protein